MRCEVVDAETAKLPGFIRANYIITWAWAACMLLMMIGNVAMIYVPGLPIWSALLIAFAARNSAVYFTKWYPRISQGKVRHAARQRAARSRLIAIQPDSPRKSTTMKDVFADSAPTSSPPSSSW